ncbi:hypothetical protein AA18895_0767 [Acetobacter ghanensis DSM 18895]|nr:hypothetical protein AA18895_0767 [Acetobacter ghanensis DSM 18895]
MLDGYFCGRIPLPDSEEMVMTEWGTGHEPDPEELVDFMTTEGCGPVRVPHIELHPIPLHAPEEGLLDEEILPLFRDWQRGPKVA